MGHFIWLSLSLSLSTALIISNSNGQRTWTIFWIKLQMCAEKKLQEIQWTCMLWPFLSLCTPIPTHVFTLDSYFGCFSLLIVIYNLFVCTFYHIILPTLCHPALFSSQFLGVPNQIWIQILWNCLVYVFKYIQWRLQTWLNQIEAPTILPCKHPE